MAVDDAPLAAGDVKQDAAIPANSEKAATDMKAEEVVTEQEVVKEKQPGIQQQTQMTENEVENPPPLPERPLPPSPEGQRPLPPPHDEKRKSLLPQPPIVRFAALPPPLTQHQQPLPVYEPDAHQQARAQRPIFPKWHKFKIYAMTLSLLVSAVVFGVAIAMGFINAPYMEAWSFYPVEVELGLSGTAAGLAILFIAIEHMRICFSTLRRGMHPGWLVTFNLLISLLAIGSIVATGAYVTEWNDYLGDYDYPTSNPATTDAARNTGILQQVLLAFDCILLVIHFVLFIGACVEVHKTNKAKRETKTIFIAVPPGGPLPEQVFHVAQPTSSIRWGPPTPRSQQTPPPQVVQYAGYYAPEPQAGPGAVPVVYQQPFQGFYAPVGPSRESPPPNRSSLRAPPPPPAAAVASGSGSGPTQAQAA